jgi:hypothetical protein
MKSLVKPTAFGVPSVEVIDRIDSSDKVSALHAAGYRFEARLSELERQFEAKASELREAYLGEVSEIHRSEGA